MGFGKDACFSSFIVVVVMIARVGAGVGGVGLFVFFELFGAFVDFGLFGALVDLTFGVFVDFGLFGALVDLTFGAFVDFGLFGALVDFGALFDFPTFSV